MMKEFKRITMTLTGAGLLLLAMTFLVVSAGIGRANEPCESYAAKRWCKSAGCNLTPIPNCPTTMNKATCDSSITRQIMQDYFECMPYSGDLYPLCFGVTDAKGNALLADCTRMKKCKFVGDPGFCALDVPLPPCQSPYYTTINCDE